SHIDRYPCENRFFDSRQALLGPRNLNEQIRACSPAVQFFGRRESALRVVGEQGRYLQRYPSVHAVGPVVNGSKEIGSLGEVLQRKIEKKRLARRSLC